MSEKKNGKARPHKRVPAKIAKEKQDTEETKREDKKKDFNV